MDFYAGLKSLLQYHRELGFGPVVKSDDVLKFLETRPQVPHQPEPPSVVVPASPDTSVGDVAKDVAKASIPEAAEPGITLADIASEVGNCTDCALRNERVYPVPGQGDHPVRLMIVGDWTSIPGDPPARNLLFGIEQDRMLFNMLAAIKLTLDDVFITNVVKCGLGENRQPQAVHVKACAGYLRRQIMVLKPEFICTMGMIAAKTVLQRSLPLSRLRGVLHDYPITQTVSSKVLTTYHPSYLLQNPEMKKATWQDLQFLAQKMGIRLKS